MKIASTDLALQSDRTALLRSQQNETLRAWRGERPDFERATSAGSVLADLSEAARRLFDRSSAVPPAPTIEPTSAVAESGESAVDNDPFLSVIKRMIELLTGEEVRVFDLQAFTAERRHAEAEMAEVSAATQRAASGRAGWGVEYDAHHVREEYEQTRFSAEGVVRTADGQEIRFSLDLMMERYYREESHVSLRAGDAVRKDPLVVNFGGTATQLRDRAAQFFRFDLDGDGKEEVLPLFASGSGFLVFDQNADGRVTSGELFGPRTGHGFAELARLDDDANGWVDDADGAFDKLYVWTPEAEGAGNLRSLAELDIGALALAHVASPFALRGSDNSDLGLVKASGLYLTESGKPGSMQEIDLSV